MAVRPPRDGGNVGFARIGATIKAQPWKPAILPSHFCQAISARLGRPGAATRNAGPQCGHEALFARQDHVAHDGIDLLLPALAREDAVVADASLHVVAAHVGLDALAQLMRRRRLAQRANVVALTLNRQKRGAADRAWGDALAAKVEHALGQPRLLEYPGHRL